MSLDVSRYLDKRYLNKSGTYPVSIRIYSNRKNQDVKTGIQLTEEDFNALHLPKVRPTLQAAYKKILEVEDAVRSYLHDHAVYDIKELRSYINSPCTTTSISVAKSIRSNNVFEWFQLKIQILKDNNQFGSAESYQSTKNVYEEFLKRSALPFSFFTVSKLKETEVSMMHERGIEISTVGKHARNLRSIFKMALDSSVISNSDYPFGRYRYIIPAVTKAKKSLTRTALRNLLTYSCKNYYEKRALGFFIFSYFGNGMNLKDIASLKYKDWKGETLHYYRKKTKNTNNMLKVIRVIVTEEMKQVIAEFGNQAASPDTYIFPILTPDLTEKQIIAKVKTRGKSLNKTLAIIARKLGIEAKITLGMSRHSFANALKQEGASISFIQEALGHGSPGVTEHYLNSFEDAISADHVIKLRSYYNKKNE